MIKLKYYTKNFKIGTLVKCRKHFVVENSRFFICSNIYKEENEYRCKIQYYASHLL